MSSKKLANQHTETFESLKRQSSGKYIEFWYARDLQIIFEYTSWDKFKNVIEKAMTACKQSGHAINDHFSQMGKMVTID